MTDDHIELRVRVTGRVQGVCYRAWTEERARQLGVTGWVRNDPDGSVAAYLAGPQAQVEALVAAMREGPPRAEVAGVTTAPVEHFTRPARFSVTR